MKSTDRSDAGTRSSSPANGQKSSRVSPKSILTGAALFIATLLGLQIAFWWGTEYSVAQSELELAADRAHAGSVYYDYEEFEYGYDRSQPPFPRPWYHRVLPDDGRPRIVDVSLQSRISPEVRSQLIERVSRMPQVRHLSFGTIHCFIDAIGPGETERVEEQIYANKVPLAPRDFEAIGKMSNLRVLDLTGTTTDDTNLAILEKLPHLEALWLRGTNVSSEGIQRLRKALPRVEFHSRFGDD